MKDRLISFLEILIIILSGFVNVVDGFLTSTSTITARWKCSALPQLLAVVGINDDENNSNEKGDDESQQSNTKKSKTRLAQLAEDWLEEEEEDELLQYWERFDAKEVAMMPPKSTPASDNEDDDNLTDNNNHLTTEERLERYFDRRGINKQKEKEHASEIEAAIATAKKATTPQQAMAALKEVRPWLQVNTRLGGNALVELAIALWQDHDEEEQEKESVLPSSSSKQKDDDPPDNSNNNRDEALLLCQELLGNPHVKQRVRQLIKNGGPPKRQSANLWGGNFNFNADPTSWWN